MAIDNNNPLEQQNNPEPNGSNSEASGRGRKKPRRDGKGSNTQANNPRTSNRPVQKPAAVGKKIKPWRPKHLVTQQRLILI